MTRHTEKKQNKEQLIIEKFNNADRPKKHEQASREQTYSRSIATAEPGPKTGEHRRRSLEEAILAGDLARVYRGMEVKEAVDLAMARTCMEKVLNKNQI